MRGPFAASPRARKKSSERATKEEKKLGKMNDSFFTVFPAPLLSVSPSCESTAGGKTTSLVAGGE
jgi:hypothetical protein